ncbi:DUF4400 domain-containing protein [Acidovorax sp. LjRoot129]|uniref:DUF4400 domain-containing protein n=1 Tax=unclassified Acidovorax TaxID=2684926 RepID=UPI003ECCD035
MAAQQKEKKHSLASVMLVIVIFGAFAVMLLVPLPVFNAVRDAEQRQLVSWLGTDTHQWVMNQIFDVLEAINKEVTAAFVSSELSGNEKIDRWVMTRAYAGTVWAHVILYRCGMLAMWTIFALPCMFAAMSDGHFRRQISKASFTSQSPMLHKRGVDLAKLVAALLVAWLFAPIYVSTWVAPFAIVGLSFAWWLWVANLQKRL